MRLHHAAQSSAAALTVGSNKMLDDSKKLFDAFSAFGSVRDTRLFPNFWLGVVSGLVALLAIIGFVWSSVRVRSREQDVRYQAQVEFNSRHFPRFAIGGQCRLFGVMHHAASQRRDGGQSQNQREKGATHGGISVVIDGCLSRQGQYRNPRSAEILLFGIVLSMLFGVVR
ncbi:hypothetical protein [Dickeya chrysanthemi]|uniref:hypothetical protein n=1 Tax=Dickeya chrysanthemi TaxID=556 RepID=UPI003340C0D4